LTVSASPLDSAVSARVVDAVTPLTVEPALAALTSLEERDAAVAGQWRRRIERARYDADLAERRYAAVDPANRLIAATLETRWNDAEQRVLDLEAEMAAFERQTLRAVTAEQKQQIVALGRNFPRLWTASSTSPRDRKRMLRLLIKDITVAKGPKLKQLQLHIRWQGGATETLTVHLPANRADAVRYPPAFVDEVRTLAQSHDDREIATLLARDGRKSATGKPFTASMISWIRFRHGIPGPSAPPGTLTVHQVAQRYGVSRGVVYYWIDQRVIPADRKPGKSYVLTITAVDQRLRAWVANSSRIPVTPQPFEQGAL